MEEPKTGAPETAFPKPSYAYVVVGILMFAYIFAYLDRFILSLLIDPISKDLHLNDEEMALVGGTSFAICFALFSFPFGRWIDGHGRRNVIVLGMVLWSLATMACGLANSFWRLFTARMMVGVGEASLSPAAYSMIADLFPPRKRGFATSIYMTGVSVGGGIALLCGGIVVGWASSTHLVLPVLGELAPWKIVFLAAGFPGLLVAVLVYFAVREPKRQIHTTSADTPSLREVFRYIGAHKKMFFPAFIGFAGFTICGYAFQFWGPTFFMRVHGFSPEKAGILFGLSFAIPGTIGIMLGGLWSDRWVAKGHPDAFARVARWAAALQIIAFVPAYLVGNSAIAAALFCVGMFGNCLIGGLQGTMIQAITPNRMRGMMSAIYGTLMNITGLAIAPPITAVMSTRVFGGNLGPALAVTSLFGMLLVLILVSLALKALRARVEALQGG